MPLPSVLVLVGLLTIVSLARGQPSGEGSGGYGVRELAATSAWSPSAAGAVSNEAVPTAVIAGSAEIAIASAPSVGQDASLAAPTQSRTPTELPLVSSAAPTPLESTGRAATSGEDIATSEEAEQPQVYTVSLADRAVFTLRAPHDDKSAEGRVRQAAKALASVAREKEVEAVNVVREGDVRAIYVGRSPIIRLTALDAELHDSSLDVYADEVAAAVRRALDAERQRSEIAQTVFSTSLVVFFALVAFYLMRKLGELAERGRRWVETHGDLLVIRVRRFELVRSEMLQSGALVGVGIAKWLGQLGIFYAWLVVVLSLFESTRGYTEKLTGFVLAPLSQLAARIATTLPLLVVALIAAAAVFVLIRFVGLLFSSVARHETNLAWVPADLALPTSVLLRSGIVIAALVFAAPVVTGDSDGAFARAGSIALLALGLASTPLLASVLMGSVVLFGRRLRVGEHAEIGGVRGRIQAINLLEIRLETNDKSNLRIPHLLLLKSPVRHLGPAPRVEVQLCVAAHTGPREVEGVLQRAAADVGRDVNVELVSADARGLVYSISVTCRSLTERSLLLGALIEALATADIALGHALPPEKARLP